MMKVSAAPRLHRREYQGQTVCHGGVMPNWELLADLSGIR
jgi:hypothetical protein